MAPEPESAVDVAIAAMANGRDPDWVALRLDATAADRPLLDELALVLAAAKQVLPLGPPQDETIGVTAPAGASGERWGALEILETIGHGSHGAVFKAWDTRLARMVALKLVRVDDDRAVEALREARLLARLSHPNIVSIHGADRQGATVGWWMQLIAGSTLEDLLASDGPRSAEETIVIGLAVGRALAAVHREGLVHNDIKPKNIMRETGGRIVLMDFSTGGAIHQGVGEALAGTPLYMAPELFAGAAPSAQSDIYSLGVVLFRLATGEYPVTGSTFDEVRRAHESQRGERPASSRSELPTAFATALDRALAPDPSHRYQTADAFVRGLSTAIGARTERRTWPWWLAGAVLAASVVGYVASGVLRPSPAASQPNAGILKQTLSVWRGYENLALEHAARGEYAAAGVALSDAARVARAILPEDAPLIGWSDARRGRINSLAGREEEALRQHQTGLHTMRQHLGVNHPYRATAFIGYAASLQKSGRHADALEAVCEALAIRQHFLGLSVVPPADAPAATGLNRERLMAALRQTSVAVDSDDDGLPDVVEIALGFDPKRTMTHPPEKDGDGDVDRDGWPDRLELGWDWDPARVIAHYGGVDPTTLGFGTIRDFRASASSETGAQASGWRIVTDSLGHYTMPIPPRLKSDATAAFVLTARLHAEVGGAYIVLDLVPVGPRFDMDSYRTRDGGLFIKTNTAVVPVAGPEYPVARNRRPLLQMSYSRADGARLWIDGVVQKGRYDGHRTYQEDDGLIFGAFNLFGEVPKGETVFELVHLVIKEQPQRATSAR